MLCVDFIGRKLFKVVINFACFRLKSRKKSMNFQLSRRAHTFQQIRLRLLRALLQQMTQLQRLCRII